MDGTHGAKRGDRLFVGLGVAPIATALAAVFITPLFDESLSLGAAPIVFLATLLLAYPIAVVVALPAYMAMQALGWLTLGSAMAASTMGGLVLGLVLGTGGTSSTDDSWALSLYGGALGCVMGAAWAVAAGMPLTLAAARHAR